MKFQAFWAALLLIITGMGSADAALTLNTSTNTSTNVTAVPLAQIDFQSQAAANQLDAVSNVVASEPSEADIRNDLPAVTDQIEAQLQENDRIFSSRPSLESLRALESEWQELHEELQNWNQTLTKRIDQLGAETTLLSALDKKWTLTRSAVETKAPPAILTRIDTLRGKISAVTDQAKKEQAEILDLQSKISAQTERIAQALNSIHRTRDLVLNHLFVQDSPPVTSGDFWGALDQKLFTDAAHSLSTQVTAVRSYISRRKGRFVLHAGIFVAILAFLYWLGRSVRQRSAVEEGLRPAAVVFGLPIATALMLTLMASHWIYPQAPRLLRAVFGAALLVPATIVLRKFIERRLIPVLTLLVVFFFVDQIRVVAESQQILTRLLFLGETLTGAIFFALMMRSRQFTDGPAQSNSAYRKWAFLLVVVFSFSLLANVAGCVILSKLVGGAILSGAYLGLVLVALLRILDALNTAALNVAPLARLRMVTNNRALLQHNVKRWLTWVAIILWVLFILGALSIRGQIFHGIHVALTAEWTIGGVNISLAHALGFVVAMWAAFVVSHFVRFVLREEVYPRVTLAPGLHYSISMMLHYVVLIIGFFFALSVLGVGVTHLTILAGAFSVGLGFGLQNIVNNFVSGIILLFERPVKVGDVILVDSGECVVTRIGIRASVVRSIDGSEIIVPNGTFISNNVTNLTLATDDLVVRILIGVTPGPTVNGAEIIQALKEVAAANPKVLKTPPPQGVLLGFTGGALNFELRAWIAQGTEWREVRSELSVAISAAAATRNLVLK